MEDSIGRRLRQQRRARDLSQKQLAQMTNLTQPTISGIERGNIRFPGYLARVASALGVDVSHV